MTVQPIDRNPDFGRGSPPMPGVLGPGQPGLPARGTGPVGSNGGPGGVPGSGGLPLTSQNGLDLIRTLFAELFGGALTDLAVRFWNDYLNDVPFDVIVAEVRKTPEYAQRFPGMKSLRDRGRPISEAQYLALEREFTQNRRMFGLPTGFYDDPSDFGAIIAAEVSAEEDRARLQAWQTYERESRDPIAAEQFRATFADIGVPLNDGDFLALAMDPGRAVTAIERRLAAGQIGTESVRAGFGQLSVTESLRLADAGVSRDQARSGFDALAGARELFTALPGEGGETIGRDEQIGAAFGTDAAARRRIDTQRRRRLTAFEGGGGVSGGRGGFVGLAPAE